MTKSSIETKARRRVKRFIAGKPTHRVREENGNYHYIVKHHGEEIVFKVRKNGTLVKQKLK